MDQILQGKYVAIEKIGPWPASGMSMYTPVHFEVNSVNSKANGLGSYKHDHYLAAKQFLGKFEAFTRTHHGRLFKKDKAAWIKELAKLEEMYSEDIEQFMIQKKEEEEQNKKEAKEQEESHREKEVIKAHIYDNAILTYAKSEHGLDEKGTEVLKEMVARILDSRKCEVLEKIQLQEGEEMPRHMTVTIPHAYYYENPARKIEREIGRAHV